MKIKSDAQLTPAQKQLWNAINVRLVSLGHAPANKIEFINHLNSQTKLPEHLAALSIAMDRRNGELGYPAFL
jgi:hypothetical protein